MNAAESEVLGYRAAFDDGTYPKDFWGWLVSNLHIFRLFVATAIEARERRHFKRWSGRSIMEVIRWETSVREGGQDSLKVNDHAVPGLARLAMETEPRLMGFFSLRTPPATSEARRLIDGELYANG